jgi:hypothetical protein
MRKILGFVVAATVLGLGCNFASAQQAVSAFTVTACGGQSLNVGQTMNLTMDLTGDLCVFPTNSSGAPLYVTYPDLLAAVQGSIATGNNVIGKVGIDQTTPGTTNLVAIVGKTAPGVDASTTNPVVTGAVARTVNVSTKGTGQVVADVATAVGVRVTKPYSIPELEWKYAGVTGGITDTSTVALSAAGASGIKNYLTALQYLNASAVASEIVVLDGASTVIWRGYAPALMTQEASITFPSPLGGTAATAMNVAMVTTGTATRVSAQGYQAP